jgi:hypothetical protein
MKWRRINPPGLKPPPIFLFYAALKGHSSTVMDAFRDAPIFGYPRVLN